MPDPISSIDGTWQMVRAELGGAPAPDLVVQKTELEFRAGIYVVRFDREESDRGSYELGGTGHTRTITLRGEKGMNAGRTIAGLYQLNGDRLRVCYGLDGKIPTGFSTCEGRRFYLAMYRRTQQRTYPESGPHPDASTSRRPSAS